MVTAGAVLAAGHNAGEALVPVLIGRVIDSAVSTGHAGALVRWLLVLAAVFAGLSYSYRFGARAGERAAEQAAHQIRIDVTRRVLDPRGSSEPAGGDPSRLSGAVVSIATSDAQRVGAVNIALPAASAAIAGILVSAIALLRVSVPLGLLVLLGAPPLFGPIIIEALALIASGRTDWVTQDRSKASFFHKRSVEDSRIDWTWSAEELDRLIRAQSDPYPNAFTFYRSKRVRVLSAVVSDRRYGGTPGRVFIREGGGVVIVAGADARRGRSKGLVITRVRTDDGQEHAATDFFRTMGSYLTSHP